MFRIPSLVKKPPVEMSQFSGIMAFINEDDRSKEDIQITGSQLDFTDRKTLALPTKKGTEEWAFNDHSFDQLATMLKIPTKYLLSCPIVGKGGMKDQVEARMADRETKNLIIRLRRSESEEGVSGIVRAILPGNYTLFDNRHMVASLQRATREAGGDFQLLLSNVTDPKGIEQSLQMRFVRKQAFEVIGPDKGDPHAVGFHAMSSEIGMTDIRIDALVHRLVCSNGMMGWDGEEAVRIHYRNLQVHEVNPQIQEGVAASLRQEAPIKDLLERKYAEPVENPETVLRFLGMKMRVSDFVLETAEATLHSYDRNPYTRFDIMQAFTQAAQSLPMQDRIKLEMAVGKTVFRGRGSSVVDMPSTDDN